MHERTHNLVVRVDDDELDKLHAIAEHRDATAAQVVRQFIKDMYRATFGEAPPPKRRTTK